MVSMMSSGFLSSNNKKAVLTSVDGSLDCAKLWCHGTNAQRTGTATDLAEILSIARAQLAVHGAAGLSMRAVARALGVVSSAVYRYVASRDELLTLMLMDGYNALGDTVDHAVDTVPSDDSSAQWRALGRAVREWALAEPARYGLLFGAPVPDYEAPAAQTMEPGTRVVLRLVRLIEDAYKAGVLDGQPHSRASAQAPAVNFAAVRAELELEVPDAVLASVIGVWTALFGAVNFEVFGQYGGPPSRTRLHSLSSTWTLWHNS